MKAWINGIGWVTARGCGLGQDGGEQPLQPGPLEIPTRKQVFAEVDKRFGRLDDFSRIGLAAITFCLRDARAESWQEKRPIGIIAASRFGCLATDLAYLETMIPAGGKLASPNLFAYTLPNCFLGEAALRFGLCGNSLLLNQFDPAQLAALHYALDELAWGENEALLAGVCDLPFPGDEAESTPSGSVFLLLGRTAGEHGTYGELCRNGACLQLNAQSVTTLPELLAACLALKNKR